MRWLADYKFRVRVASVQTFYNLHCSPEIQADRGNGRITSQYESSLIIFTQKKELELHFILFLHNT